MPLPASLWQLHARDTVYSECLLKVCSHVPDAAAAGRQDVAGYRQRGWNRQKVPYRRSVAHCGAVSG